MQPRFISWAAVSSLPQAKKVSLEDQLETNREHVNRWNGILVEELVVPGESRSIVLFEDACKAIAAYSRLRELIRQRALDVLIYLDRSRLGRKASLSMAVIELCHEAGIITYATESPPSNLELPERNFAAQITGAIESVVAQEEVVKMKKRHKMGMIDRVRRGEFPGVIPYGWDVSYDSQEGIEGRSRDAKPVRVLTVNEEARQVLHLFVELYTKHGLGLHLIAQVFHERGYAPPNDGRWSRSSVLGLLNLIWRYAGFVELNRRSKERPYVKAQSRWPALITEDDAKAVTAERQRRAKAKRSVARVHILSQIVWCERCRLKMKINYTRKPGTSVTHINYRCVDGEGVPRHPHYNISAKYLLEALRSAILFIQDEQNRHLILEEHPDTSRGIRQSIIVAKQRLATIHDAIQRADDAYVLGSMTLDRHQRQINKLLEQQSRIQKDIAQLEIDLDKSIYDSQREARLSTIAFEGLSMLESTDTAMANAWFIRHFRVWVTSVPSRQIRVEYL